MTPKSKTIVFFGTDNFSLKTLQTLFDADYNIAAVVTKPDAKSGRGQKTTSPAVKSFAIQHNITVLQPAKVSEINDFIKNIQPTPIGVLVSYGKIIPAETIDLFNPGIINIHPSLLPLYRGSTPIESAIRNDDHQTGVSIMQLTPEMDAGPIYVQSVQPLNGTETSPELYNTLSTLGANKITKVLNDIIDGKLAPTAQDSSKASYCNLLKKEEAWVDFSQVTSSEANNIIRANLLFPKTKIKILNHDIIITKAHTTNNPTTILDIKCKSNSHLSIDELIAPSGRKMSAKDFLNGYNLKLG